MANIKAKKFVKIPVNACGINDILRVIILSLGLLLLGLLFLPEVRLMTVSCGGAAKARPSPGVVVVIS